ncbi:MAG TPA: hypothetical protein VMQ65_09540 [Candidatus Limnocylindria bacterium]|nr:hypothetical protein [Candidatus Limnocylindria bacterium]
MLAIAAREPRTLAIGLDANAAAMAEASRRAAGPARKGGLANAAFILAAAEAPPSELCGAGARVTVLFPWGSLLRGCVGGDAPVAAGVAGLVAPGGALELLLAPSVRDGLDGLPLEPNELAAAVQGAFEGFDLGMELARPALDAEVRASGSTWARRLGSQRPADRRVMLMRLVRPLGGATAVGGSGNGRVAR